MSVTRVVRRNLQRAGEVKHPKGRTWRDLRSRDKDGFLSGYCSVLAHQINRLGGQKVVGVPSGQPGISA